METRDGITHENSMRTGRNGYLLSFGAPMYGKQDAICLHTSWHWEKKWPSPRPLFLYRDGLYLAVNFSYIVLFCVLSRTLGMTIHLVCTTRRLGGH